MKPTYLDIHIHTSENPKELDENYDSDTLLSKVSETAQGTDFLVSLTDHNTLNEKAYLNISEKIKTDYPNSTLILGVELHIQIDKEDKNAKAYHCHIFFDLEVNHEILQEVNKKLDNLYPNKAPEKTDDSIPTLEQVLHKFDEYDFLILPHGAQSHATLDKAYKSLSEEKRFDNTLYKNIYYNFIDGFTARSKVKLKDDLAFLTNIGIDEFVGYITSTDNYKPDKYPQGKHSDEGEFVPTWMFAKPTFDGLRISLSDTSRLKYSKTKPSDWRESIKNVVLNNAKISINAEFTPGLNVIIGGSSSGKTLLVDSIYKHLNTNTELLEESVYAKEFLVSEITVDSTGAKPYLLSQNYITTALNGKKRLDEIPLLGKLFPNIDDYKKQREKGLNKLKVLISNLFDNVEKLEKIGDDLTKIPVLSELILTNKLPENPLEIIKGIAKQANPALEYEHDDYGEDKDNLEKLHIKLSGHPIIKKTYNAKSYDVLLSNIELYSKYSITHQRILESINKHADNITKELDSVEKTEQRKQENIRALLNKMSEYKNIFEKFESNIADLSIFKESFDRFKKKIGDHELYFTGDIEITPKIIKDALNKHMYEGKRVKKIDDIKLSPEKIFTSNFRKNDKGGISTSTPTYDHMKDNVFQSIKKLMDIEAKIDTEWGDFETLSPGKKSAVILDLILNYKEDSAPIIIDQPEDNLSVDYINDNLVKTIKKIKEEKQIIFVSHNATIPMIGDAQNIILCQNNNGKITITSAPLESKIDGRKVVDYIAEITDGGKSSVKKRFKKYDLKKFKE